MPIQKWTIKYNKKIDSNLLYQVPEIKCFKLIKTSKDGIYRSNYSDSEIM